MTAPIPLPLLPEPQRPRWQPLRMGLVDLYHYDCEEFWFRDGHLLLRGNNDTGKSKVLSRRFLSCSISICARRASSPTAIAASAWNGIS
jgi:hypothetical protein